MFQLDFLLRSPKYTQCRVSGTTRKLRRNEFVPKLSSKQNVEYLSHATLQWTTDGTKITFDSNSLVVNKRQVIVMYWYQNFRSQNKEVVLQLKNKRIYAANKLLNFNVLVAFTSN